MDRTRHLIAVLDDEPQFCRALARLLRTHDFDVETFSRGEEFLAYVATQSPCCLLLDLHMPEFSGFEILKRIAGKNIPVLVITGHDDPGSGERVRALGGMGYFLKPVNETQLLQAIHDVLGHSAPGGAPANISREKT